MSTWLRLAIGITSMSQSTGRGKERSNLFFKGDLYVVHITSAHLPFIMWFHLAARQAGIYRTQLGSHAHLKLREGFCYQMGDVGKD